MTLAYLWLKVGHLISVICWFAALFYLPRLFVYHAMSEDDISHRRFVIMERKLYRGIMTPAMLATWGFGVALAWLNFDTYKHTHWLWLKIALVILLSVYHGACNYYRLQLVHNAHLKSHVFWRVFNEAPTLALIVIVSLAVVKPF